MLDLGLSFAGVKLYAAACLGLAESIFRSGPLQGSGSRSNVLWLIQGIDPERQSFSEVLLICSKVLPVLQEQRKGGLAK